MTIREKSLETEIANLKKDIETKDTKIIKLEKEKTEIVADNISKSNLLRTANSKKGKLQTLLDKYIEIFGTLGVSPSQIPSPQDISPAHTPNINQMKKVSVNLSIAEPKNGPKVTGSER